MTAPETLLLKFARKGLLCDTPMIEHVKDLSYTAPFLVVAAIAFFNAVIKEAQNNFVVCAPLLVAVLMLLLSLFTIKKTWRKFTHAMLIQSLILALIDFLILRFVLALLLRNSIVTLLGSLSLGIVVVNFLYARTFSMGYACILACATIAVYTLLLENVETRGCITAISDFDTLILPHMILSSFNLLYLIPLRIYVFGVTSPADNKSLHHLLSINMLAISVFQIFFRFDGFKTELALIAHHPVYLTMSIAILAPLCALFVFCATKMNYTKFVQSFSVSYGALMCLYFFEMPSETAFRKNGLEQCLANTYALGSTIPLMLIGTCSDLYDTGSGIFERLARTDIIPWL